MPTATIDSRVNMRRFSRARWSTASSFAIQKPVFRDDEAKRRECDQGEQQRGFDIAAHAPYFSTGGVSKVWYGAGVGRCVHSSESAPSQGSWGAFSPLRIAFSMM